MTTSSLRDRLQTSLGGAYTLERELGGGGMSHVFVADDAALGRKVVVKVLSTELTGGVNVERFNREIRLAATLQHPCIVPVHSAGEADGLPYYTMPLVEGETLRARLARDGALGVPEVVRIMRDVAQSLSYAHERGVVHRDIKPDNILLTRHHALVTDFGVAKALSASTITAEHDAATLTQLGMSVGTPAYMAPEQAIADPSVDHRADLYALGVTAYEMLTGRQLFSKRSPAALLVAHATENPDAISASRPEVPPALDALVMRLLAKSPAARPQSADEVLAELDAVATPSPESSNRVRNAGTAAVVTAPTRRFARWIVPAIAVIGVAVIAAVMLFARRPGPSSGADAGPSVAVLPFVNLSGDTKDDYLGDGLSEELIDALSKLERLKVAARTSSFAFRGATADVRNVGRRLGVTSVLTGSVRRAGNKLRVTTQLVNAGTGFNLWSDTYDREMTDVFAVQDDITRSIVGALRVRLGSGGQGAIQARPAKNVQAYESYLKGIYAVKQRGRTGLTDGVRYLLEAIAGDSTYAPAYAALAGGLVASVSWNLLPPADAYRRARAAAVTAIALDSNLADAHEELGNVMCSENQFAQAEGEFQRALALNPGLAIAHYHYAWCLIQLGRPDDAVREGRRAVELDPLNSVVYAAVGRAYLHARRYREGIDALEPARGVQPEQSATHGWRSQLYAGIGDFASSIRESRTALEMSPTNLWKAAYASVLARAGLADSARAMLREPERDTLPPSFWIAQTYASLGDRDRAFSWLNRALEERSGWMTEIRAPAWDSVRNDPRFVEIARKIGLTASR